MAALRNSPSGYGWVSIALHWTVAILFLGEIPLGYLTQVAAGHPARLVLARRMAQSPPRIMEGQR